MVLILKYISQSKSILSYESFTCLQIYLLLKVAIFRETFKKCLNIIILTNPSTRAGYDTRSIFKRSLTGLNSEYSFSLTGCLTKAEEPSLSYYLPITGGRIIGFIPFPRVLVLCLNIINESLSINDSCICEFVNHKF